MAETPEIREYELRLKKALQVTQQMRIRLDSLEKGQKEPIAIVGMSCRFPGGADTPEAYWQLLRNSVDAISEVPASRWKADDFYDPDPLVPGKSYTRRGGFLHDVEGFDAEFFGIAPREATAMDPQQRLLLELSWEALDAAGQAQDRLVGSRTGVFVGISTSDYAQYHLNSGDVRRIDAYSGTGVALSIAAGRISYVYGFQGPNAAVDTFCSSSLVAIHLACQSLRRGESDMALAGGVNLILSPAGTIYSCKVHALAPDGRCKTFDASADGYGRGEGCGILVLKRLSDAVASHDRIIALIRGTAMNHDGRSSGLTVPNGTSQQAVIRAALDNAGVGSEDVSYVEAHGTGTPLGDPVELRAIGATVASKRSKQNPLFVGSAKTNIGHLEAAAGVAGVMKVALALQNREIPAHLHLQSPNPHVQWEELSVEIPTSTRTWDPVGKSRIAGVSSFGFSGTNAHVVLEQAPLQENRIPAIYRSEHILLLSARTPAALATMVERYRDFLAENPGLALHDLCYTANVRRSHHEHRAAFITGSLNDLAVHLASFAPKPATAAEEFALVFPGRITIEDVPDEPVFQEMRSRCDRAGAPAHFTTLMAHAALWKSWGVRPGMIVAKGPAASAAGWFSGVLSFQDSLAGTVPSGLASSADGLPVLEIGAAKPLDALAGLYTSGIAVDWSRVYPSGNLIPLPAYPWQHRRFWIDDVTVARAPRATRPGRVHALLGRRILSPALAQVVHEAEITASSPSFLKDHRILRQVVFPASAWVEMLIAASEGLPLSDLAIREPLVLPENETVTVQTIISEGKLEIYSLADGGRKWKLHVSAAPGANDHTAATPNLVELETRLRNELSAAGIYERTRAFGLDYGPSFRGLRRLRWNDTEALGDIELSGDPGAYTVHPALFDSCLQVLGVKLLASASTEPFLPSKIGSLRVVARPSSSVRCYVRFSATAAPGTWEADMQVINSDGRLAIDVHGIVCRPVPKAAASDRFRYTVEWREKESFFADEQGEPGLWILLADSTGLAARVAKKLMTKDQQCVMVTAGESYSFNGVNAVLNLSRPEDFRRLIEDAPAQTGLALAGFVHMWALDEPDERAILSAFHAVQAIGRAKLHEPPKFCAVTRAGQALAPNAPVPPYNAAFAGFARTVTAEHPELHPIVIDLPPHPDGSDETQLLFEELLARNPEDVAAIRNGVRYVPRLQYEKPARRSTAVNVKSEATYLITGGLGALGLQVAQWLADKGARHLALVSRTEPSEMARETLRTLEVKGVEVRLVKADVSKALELKAALTEIDNDGAPLAGIIHAAGFLDDGLLVQQNWERFSRVLAPKTAGAWNLHELTKDRALDFCVFFSSAASLFGNPGQASYAAANAFLDGLAAHRRSLGLPGVSIAWGAWSGAGMAARVGAREQRAWSERGIEAIAPDRGLTELDELLDSPAPQIAVFKMDWGRFARQYPTGGEAPLLSELVREARQQASQSDSASDARVKLLRRLENSSPVERLEILADFVRMQVADVLGFSESAGLDPNQGFFEVGMDSLMAVDLQRRLQNGLGITLPSTIGFDHPTIEALAKHLAEKALKFRNTVAVQGPPAAAMAKKHSTKESIAQESIEEMPEDQLVALLSQELATRSPL
jgi:acyl transferase domain-containing protein/acyl carrier protein